MLAFLYIISGENSYQTSEVLLGVTYVDEVRSFAFYSTVKCYLLNIDVITMFSPEMVDELSNAVEQCEKCIKAMETLSYEDTSKEPSG